MILKINVMCSSCNSSNVIIDENEYTKVIICKNENCDDFNCFWELNSKYIHELLENNTEIENGLTGELTFENDEGKFYECYKNGKIIESRRL